MFCTVDVEAQAEVEKTQIPAMTSFLLVVLKNTTTEKIWY